MLLGLEGTPVEKILNSACAYANSTSRGLSVINVHLDIMDQVATLANALVLVTMMAHATVRLASVCVELDLKAMYVISVPLATSTILCVNFVAAVRMGPCQKAVMPLGDATVGQSMLGFIVTSAALDIIPTLIAKPAPVTLEDLWIMIAAQLVNANATQITWAIHATSVHPASMAILPVHLATVPQKVLSLMVVIKRLGSVPVVPEWLAFVVILVLQEHMDFHSVKWVLVIQLDLQMQTPLCQWVPVTVGHMWKAKLVISASHSTGI